MRVEHLMRTDVNPVSEHDDLALALQVMLWQGARHVPVKVKTEPLQAVPDGDD